MYLQGTHASKLKDFFEWKVAVLKNLNTNYLNTSNMYTHWMHWDLRLFFIHPCVSPWLDAGGCRSVWSGSEPAQLLWPGEDGLHDGLCCGNGCWSHVWHFLLSQVAELVSSLNCLWQNYDHGKITNCLCFCPERIGMRGRELMGGVGKTMMQSGGTFGTFMAIGMGIRCWGQTTSRVMGLF